MLHQYLLILYPSNIIATMINQSPWEEICRICSALYHINLYHGQISLKWTKMNRETNFCLTCWKQWARWRASFILINFPHSCTESLRPVTNDSCLINNWTAWDTPRVIKVAAACLCLSTVMRKLSISGWPLIIGKRMSCF